MANANWQTMPARGGVIVHRLRITPEGAAARYVRVFEVQASDGSPAEYQAQFGPGLYITRHASVEEAKASLERDPRVLAALAACSRAEG